MASRSGAAKWVKSKMNSRKPPVLEDFDKTAISSSEAAENAAKQFAERWNVGVYEFKRNNVSTTKLTGDQPVLHNRRECPAARHAPELNTDAFHGAPPNRPPAAWSAEVVLSVLPDGAPGPDAQASEWISQLHFDSLDRLATY